jgi:hypothetical protein
VVHLLSVSNMAVNVRFALYLVQWFIMAAMVFRLLTV